MMQAKLFSKIAGFINYEISSLGSICSIGRPMLRIATLLPSASSISAFLCDDLSFGVMLRDLFSYWPLFRWSRYKALAKPWTS
jgi:hypothetical protein